MRWDDYRRSDNVFNRRGEGGSRLGGGGGGGLAVGFMLLRFVFSRFGIGGVVVLVIGFLLVSQTGLLSGGGQLASGAGGSGAAVNSAYDEEIGAVLASTEDVWNRQFQEKGIGDYPEPSLNLFAGGITTQGCGFASSAVGPFYCPADREIYIDTQFFDQLSQQLGAPGDFARAYVIAHEVGHHIQTVTGISDEVRRAQAGARSKAQQNEYQVRMELMADCLAGVWARNAGAFQGFSLEQGDVQEGLRAASAIGDDTLQRNAGRRVSPDSFTHGTSEQRQRWLATGYETGDMQACDTLNGAI